MHVDNSNHLECLKLLRIIKKRMNYELRKQKLLKHIKFKEHKQLKVTLNGFDGAFKKN